MRFSRSFATFAFCLFATSLLRAEPVAAPAGQTLTNLPYKPAENASDYERERCKLDLYLPAGRAGFPTLVWFHGGGLTAGKKDDEFTAKIMRFFASRGIAAASVSYRLSPRTPFPGYVEDAAAAFAWVRAHIAEHGGSPERVFIGGHSAGAYLASMVVMDPRFLQKAGLEPEAVAGAIPVAGQMMTHFTVRAERGIEDRNKIIADEAAPIYFTRKEHVPPLLLILGDHDWPARVEENAFFTAAQHVAGNQAVTQLVVPDRTHGSIAGKIPEPGDPAGTAMVEFIERIAATKR